MSAASTRRMGARRGAPGRVHLVGAGPGDPGLLTVRGRYLLRTADAVVHDRLIGRGILALIRGERFDVGKVPGKAAAQQKDIDALLVRLAREGKRVVRLKGGDPFVFGRAGFELDALVDAGIPFEIVPGVTSAIAVPAYAGVPVTDRRLASAFVVVTATQGVGAPPVDWDAVARIPTVVVLMGGARIADVAQRLIAAGMLADRPAIAVQDGTTARQRVVRSTLGAVAQDMAAAGLRSPVTVVVGEVAALGERYGWALTPSRSATARPGRRDAPRPRPTPRRRSRTRDTRSERRSAAGRGRP